jgi:hypothetical protein
LVNAEGALSVSHGAQALAAGTTAIAITDDDADFGRRFHFISLHGRL